MALVQSLQQMIDRQTDRQVERQISLLARRELYLPSNPENLKKETGLKWYSTL